MIQQRIRSFLMGFLMLLNTGFVMAQVKPVEELTQDNILSLSFDELTAYSLEDIVKMAAIVGVSIDDLYNRTFNKGVSIASKHEENYFDTPLSTSVLTAEDIERAGVMSIPEMLRLMPGVIVREKSNGNYDVKIRGSNSIDGQQSLFSENTLTLVMIDGRIVYSCITGGTFWEALPIGIRDIERIEVIRGAASVLYGANAVTGVINIITKKSSPEKVSIEANSSNGILLHTPYDGIGSMGSQNLSVFVNSSERLKFRIAANVTDRDRTQSDIYFYTNPVGYHPVDSVAVYGSDPKKMFSNPKKAIKAMGATGLVSYRLNDNIRFDLTAGLQKSSAIITGMEIFFFAHTERVSNSQFFNLQTKIYDFDIHLDHAWGRDDIVKGLPGMSAGRSTTNLNVEYKKHWNNLMFNAGLAAVYNSLKENPAGSFYKGTQTLYSWSPNIHLDYQATEKLRLIAGIRLENNKIPTKPYLTWQLVGSYKFSENSILRAVYSRANRSPFMLDMNFDSSVAMKTNPTNTRWTDVYMEGDKKLKLVVADMVEAGYRQKIGKHILVTLELFHSQVSGYNAPVMKEFGAWIDFTDLDAAAVLAGKMPTVSYAKLYYNFQNIPEKQMQTGGTAGLGIVVDGLSFRLWGTLQQTTTQNHNINPATMKQMGDLLGADVYPYMVAIALGLPKPPMKYDKGNGYFLVTNDDISPNYVNTTSKSTPSFYGGYEVNWRFIKHFSLFSSGYTYSRHEFSDRLSDQTFPIHAKLLMNGKIAYHFQESNQLFLSVNNILNATDTEYGFLDRTGMQIVVGLNVKF